MSKQREALPLQQAAALPHAAQRRYLRPLPTLLTMLSDHDHYVRDHAYSMDR